MVSNDFDAVALLALPRVAEGSYPEKGLLSWERPRLIEGVRSRGVDVAVVRGAASIDVASGRAQDVVCPEYVGSAYDTVTLSRLGDVALSRFGVVRTIVAPVDVDHMVSVLNPTVLRRLAKDKYKVGQLLLEPSGMYERDSAHIDSVDNLSEVLASIGGSQIVAKPNNGLKSHGVVVGDKTEVLERLRAMNAANYLIEQKLDFTAPLPGIRGIDDEQQRLLDQANLAGVNKEVRLYAFGEGLWSTIVRVGRFGATDFHTDRWLYVDQDSLPQQLFEAGENILNKIEEHTGFRDVHVAIDFVYTTTQTDADPKWRVMEVNAAEPQLVQSSQNETISRVQHDMLAAQIARVARNQELKR